MAQKITKKECFRLMRSIKSMLDEMRLSNESYPNYYPILCRYALSPNVIDYFDNLIILYNRVNEVYIKN